MTAVKAKWAEMSWYRRILLVVMVLEMLAFFCATLFAVNRSGLEYGGSLLFPGTEGGLSTYEGTVDGEAARFTVSPEGEVSYQWGAYAYGPWQVTEDPAAAPEGFGSSMTGLEITQGDRVLFRGGYLGGSFGMLYQENGAPLWSRPINAVMNDGTVLGEDGREISPEEQHEPSLTALARVALDPELVHRGSILLYLLVTLPALLNVFQICFPGFFFRLSLLGHVRNIDDAEPSDWYIAMERIGWLVLAGMCLFLYWQALTVTV